MSAAAWLSASLAAALAAAEIAPTESDSAARTLRIDGADTTVEFTIAALWILRRHGHFDHLEGTLDVTADGRSARIGVRIQVDSVAMSDPEHVELLLSPAFFDANRYPWIEFVSEPFPLSGASPLSLPGHLTVRGITLPVVFNLDLENCRPGPPAPCAVVVDGVLQRSRFGMTEYRRTLADQVHLRIAAVVEQ